MPESPENSKSDRVAAIMQLFADALPEKLAEIEHNWQAYQLDAEEATLQLFCELCHSLAGSAATFGYEQAGDCAREIETIIRHKVDNQQSIDDEEKLLITGHIQRLRNIVEAV